MLQERNCSRSNKLKTVEPPYLLFKISIEIFFKVKNIHNCAWFYSSFLLPKLVKQKNHEWPFFELQKITNICK